MKNDSYYNYLCDKINKFGMEYLTDDEQAYYELINNEGVKDNEG